jgi:hypothetical protein
MLIRKEEPGLIAFDHFFEFEIPDKNKEETAARPKKSNKIQGNLTSSACLPKLKFWESL